jgi:tRNA-specific 2-thiouridylase
MKLFEREHIPSQTRVVVAMSGGVDSSVTACLVHEAGYDVVGITLQLYDQGMALGKKGACCAGQDIYDAQQVAEKVGFPHYVLDYEQHFKKEVMEDFVSSYLHGETPIPCVRCNQKVKFRDLMTTAKDLGAEALITGHYVQRIGQDSGALLHRAVDPKRDQSYFMFATTQDQLDFLRFPLGHMHKSEVREHARRFGLEIADKPDSQDICFVPNGKYVSVIEKLRPGSLEPGKIEDIYGNVLGDHTGIINYTIGQRKGLGIGGGDALYVIRLDPTHHRVVVGPKEYLRCSHVTLKEWNFLVTPESLATQSELKVKYRSAQEPVRAKLSWQDGTIPLIHFLDEEYGVSPGQACVIYDRDNERILGGGWIAEAVAANS